MICGDDYISLFIPLKHDPQEPLSDELVGDLSAFLPLDDLIWFVECFRLPEMSAVFVV